MNQHRVFQRVALVFFLAGGNIAAGAETLIDQLFTLRNFELAEAYWQAGQKFIELGQKDRGLEFQTAAKRLFPGFSPGIVPVFAPVETPAAAPVAEAPKLPDATAVREKNLQAEKIARLSWNKLLRGALTGNAATVASVLATGLELPDQRVETAGLESAIAGFFEANPWEASTPADLYDLDTVELAEVADSGAVVLTVKTAETAPDLTAVLSFWFPVQKFTFVREGDTWKLGSIAGQEN